MIKGQFDRVKELALKQIREIVGDITKDADVLKLANDQFFDAHTENYIKPRIYKMPESNRSNFKELTLEQKAIYVLCKSKVFTYKEVSVLLANKVTISHQGVKRRYKTLRSIF